MKKVISHTQSQAITTFQPMNNPLSDNKLNRKKVSPGTVLKQRYVLEQLLGKGGMSDVFAAKDQSNGQNIAIKVLTGDFRDHPHAPIVLKREADKTRQLAHPNIVEVYEFDVEDGLVFFTMERLDGSTLKEILKKPADQTLMYDQAIAIIQQLALGLAHAHSKGIVHCDLKPANIFLTHDNQVKIFDFGISRAINDKLGADIYDTAQLGAITLSYASLEMINAETPHPSDDVYALGIIACELLGEDHPFHWEDAKTVTRKQLKAKLPKIPNPHLIACINNALQLHRHSRIANAEIFLAELNRALQLS
ncbi:MAG: hypothetical protein COA42_07850 [Alteromonadaceae bacterium]|nr:MAG: hypothetical protein COA42_07850 [Alteromonadaceae bacterium]